MTDNSITDGEKKYALVAQQKHPLYANVKCQERDYFGNNRDINLNKIAPGDDDTTLISLNPKDAIKEKKLCLIAVFDGHCGIDVARLASLEMPKQLEAKMKSLFCVSTVLEDTMLSGKSEISLLI